MTVQNSQGIPATEPAPAVNPVQAPAESAPDFHLDEDRNVVIGTEETAPKEPAGPAPQTFKVTVGGEEVEVTLEEMQKGYMRQADYTRKTMSLAEERKRIEQYRQLELPGMEGARQQAQQEQATQKQPDAFVAAAKSRTCQILGINEADFDEYNPEHLAYFNVATNQLYGEATQMQQQQAYLARREQEFNAMVGEFAATEPNFEKISNWATSYIEQMPYAEHQRFMGVLRNGSMQDIRGEFDKIRGAWYKKNSPAPAPPAVEGSGTETVTEPESRIKALTFARMTEDEKARWLAENGYIE